MPSSSEFSESVYLVRIEQRRVLVELIVGRDVEFERVGVFGAVMEIGLGLIFLFVTD